MPDFNQIAKKWQKKWEKGKVFKVKEDPKRKKYYVLEMYPYPSGSGLHMGHARNYTIGDVFARFKRMNGFNVLYPMGYDSFGLPAENAAIKAKSHPKKFTESAIVNFVKQQKALGLSYDWDRKVACHTPEYYKWDQWIFLQMLKKKIVFKRNASVNWCPKCNTVLANEQVHNGKCWRHTDTSVEIKNLNQWFFKITEYVGELLEDIDNLEDWADDVKSMQKNWIGKSKGTLIDFKIEDSDKKLTVFTTRPDTLYGITFLVYAPEHPDVIELVKGTEYEEKVKKFVQKIVTQDRFERTAIDKEKEGMFIGKYALHPVTKEKVPIYIANFVLYEYGTGAIIAVPAHDQRDFEFAKKYDIPIKVVINPLQFDLNPEKMSRAYMADGNMINSGQFDGENNREAIPNINKFMEKNKVGKETTQYKLRDWLISRQRFWGCPIPIIYCDKCGEVAVPEKELPVKLPDNVVLDHSKGNPLNAIDKFVNTKCPKCNGKAKRETDTMDTFVDSSWYFLRYCDSKNIKEIFDKKKANYWMPIDTYIGGKEHATMHLIYFRFFTKFFRDIGLLKVNEPCKQLFNQGMLHKNGFVMSKSRGNVVSQEDIEEKYGIDTARFFLMFVASPEKDMEWDDKAVEGSFKFLNKVYSIVTEKKVVDDKFKNQESKMHKTIKDVTENISSFKYNIALISIMNYTNYLFSQEKVNKKAAEALLLLIAPFTPHLAEELWEKLGNKEYISLEKWPKSDEKKIDLKLEAGEEMISNTVGDISSVIKLSKIEKPNEIVLFVSEKWKYNFFDKMKAALKEDHNIKSLMGKVMDKKHGKDIAKMVPRLVKDHSKIPSVITDQDTEYGVLMNSKNFIDREFKTEVKVVKAEESKEPKAKSAMPGKPAILLK